MKGASDLPGPTLSPCVCFPEKMEEENFHSCLCESTTWPAFAHFCVSLVQSPRALLPSWGLGLQSSGLWMLTWSPPYEHPYSPHLNNGSTGLYEAHLGHHLSPPLVFSSPPFPATHFRGVTTPAWSTCCPLRVSPLALTRPSSCPTWSALWGHPLCLWWLLLSWKAFSPWPLGHTVFGPLLFLGLSCLLVSPPFPNF